MRINHEGMRYEENKWFNFVDSAVCYSIIRDRDPARVIEVGCGHSTTIIRQAFSGELICIDPKPRTEIKADLFIEARVETLDPGFVADTDVLFIDSSHVVKQGGDLPFLFFRVLPRIRAGTLVHFHDIFWPDDYPDEWADRGYNEQYFLAAFLEGNGEWEVIWPGHYLATREPERLEVMLPTGCLGSGGSFWIARH